VYALFRVVYGRRDYIASTGPFAEIDGAAAVAAEGKLRVRALHSLLADWAVELEGALARHGSILEGMTRIDAQNLRGGPKSPVRAASLIEFEREMGLPAFLKLIKSF
jgi:hypothetical protein